MLALIAVTGIAGVCGAILAKSLQSRTEQRSSTERTQALYIADAGVSAAMAALASDLEPDLGTQEDPTDFAGGAFWGEVTDNGDDTFTVQSRGTTGRGTVGVEAILERQETDVAGWAMFAGNAGADPAYTLKIGGTLLSADRVQGDVYSGGNVRRFGGASIAGDIRAAGAIVGSDGLEDRALPAPDFAAMQYETHHDYNVRQLFQTATLAYGNGSVLSIVPPLIPPIIPLPPPPLSRAYQLPAASPAHIFRKNPEDRALFTAFTSGDDYFLEDPYEPYGLAQTLGAPFDVSIPAAANGKVYYIEGNLWSLNVLMTLPTTSYRIKGGGVGGTRVTFVVKGNIYFSDSLAYGDPLRDGVAFVAIKDPARADSGNIYIGGTVPQLGLCSTIDGFLYAERNIEENNWLSVGIGALLDPLTVTGTLVAREKIKVYDDTLGLLHSQLRMDFDGRLRDGTLSLPGIPGRGAESTLFEIVSWRLTAAP